MITFPRAAMRLRLAVVVFLTVAVATGAARAECKQPANALGVSRIVEIDAANGPIYGDLTHQQKEESFLTRGEVVLTFDDGPMPWITKSILNTLDRFCTKATFFSVGRMAIAYPATLREVLARGHTVGAHTWSHPFNLPAMKPGKAIDDIERGFAAVALAAGQPIAPFFRFPGLRDSAALLSHLQRRGIASFTVDVVSNDSFISDPSELTKLVLERIERRKGGIVLFHDIKAATAKALPTILTELKARGYKVVQMRAKAPVVPLAGYERDLGPTFAKAMIDDAKHSPVPFFGTVGPTAPNAPVNELTAPARPRASAPRAAQPDAAKAPGAPDAADPWSTRVKRPAGQTTNVN